METENQTEEENEIYPEDLEALLTDEGDIEEDSEEKKVNQKQVFLLVGLGILAFVFFTIFLFPLNEIIRSILIKTGKETGIQIDAKEIQFPVFGKKRLDSLFIQFPSGSQIKVEELEIGVSLLSLLQSKFDGEVDTSFLKWESGEWALQLQSLSLFSKLVGLEDKISRWTGDGEFQISGGKFLESPEIPILGSIKNWDIKRGNIEFKIRSGRLLIEKGMLESSWFRVQFQGVIRLSDVFSYSQLDLKVCVSPSEKMGLERQDLVGMLALVPQENGKSCIPLRGTVGSPKADLPSLTGGINQPAPTTESVPAP